MKKILSSLLFLSVLALAQSVGPNTPQFPGNMPGYSDLFLATDRAETTLTLGITATDTTLAVLSGTTFRVPGLVTIDNETIAVCANGANTLTVGRSSCPNADGRGIDSTAQAHLAKAGVQSRIDAWQHNQDAAEIIALAANVAQAINVKSYGAKCDWNGTTGTDDTAAIQAAINAAQTGLGAVFLPAGACMITAPLRISATVTLFGPNVGGIVTGYPATDTFYAPGRIVNRSTNTSALLVEPSGATQWMAGVTLRDFAIEGNQYVSGATAGDGIDFDGPDGAHLRHVRVDNVLVFHAHDCGYKLSDNTYGFTGTAMQSYQNGGPGMCIADSGLHGSVSSVNLFASWFDANGEIPGNPTGLSALYISSPHAGDVHLFGGFYADSNNGGSGVEITPAVIDARLLCDGCHMEGNTGNDATLSGGYAHVFSGCYSQGSNAASNGFYINNLPGNYVTPSATIRDCEISGHKNVDFDITSNARNVQVYAQSYLLPALTFDDLGSNTQYFGAPYEYKTMQSYTLKAATPYFDLWDTGTNTHKRLLNINSSLCVTNNAFTIDVVCFLDNGDLTFDNNTVGGAKLTGAFTASRVITFPDISATVTVEFSGTTPSIGGSAVAPGACASGTVTIAGGNSAVQVAIANPVTAQPGPGFFWKAFFVVGGIEVDICNGGPLSATPVASTYFVKLIQ